MAVSGVFIGQKLSVLMLTLAGGDVNGLLLNSRNSRSVMSRSSTGSVAIRLQLTSNDTRFNVVKSVAKSGENQVLARKSLRTGIGNFTNLLGMCIPLGK